MKKQSVVTRKERDVRTCSEMWHTSGVLLEKGQQQPEGCIHQFRASLVFTAFALEAYLNHIGPKLFPDWSKLERLGPRNKLKKVAEHLALKVDGNRPWQVMEDLFGYRNDIAHGRSAQQTSTETVPLDEYRNRESLLQFVPTKWEEYGTQENAERAREDVEAIAYAIHEAANIEDELLPFLHGVQSSMSWIEPK